MEDFSKTAKTAKTSYYEARIARSAELAERERPRRERRKKDALVIGLVSAGFFALGMAAVILSKYINYSGPGFNPAEVMSIFMFSGAAVMGFWASVKIMDS